MALVSIDDSVNQARKSLESCVQSSDEELLKRVRREGVENKKSLDQGELKLRMERKPLYSKFVR